MNYNVKMKAKVFQVSILHHNLGSGLFDYVIKYRNKTVKIKDPFEVAMFCCTKFKGFGFIRGMKTVEKVYEEVEVQFETELIEEDSK